MQIATYLRTPEDRGDAERNYDRRPRIEPATCALDFGDSCLDTAECHQDFVNMQQHFADDRMALRNDSFVRNCCDPKNAFNTDIYSC